MGNLKSAPIGLTEGVVAKLVGDRPAYGKGVTHVPIAPYTKCGECGQLRTKPCDYSACPILQVASSSEPKRRDLPAKIDLNTVPSSMELRAASWKEKPNG
ncbi:hypothetical protein AAG607_13760 [Citromicrobium bathyomarinum]|uniref:hypothetical protein n=1 Tax=Citromicrobium bathyomarinum TaxID=72174 RepID=UPI00315AA6CB